MLIFLIGFMGSGKSYVGKRLAPKLNFDYLDLDEYIVQKAGKSISVIFEEDGENAFRQIESDSLKSLAERENLIVATGGGTPCFFDHMHWMNTQGKTVFLDVATPLLVKRLQAEVVHRPLLAKLSNTELAAYIEQKIAERRHFYEQAQLTLKQENEAADRVISLLEMIGSC